jgi:hypothetical protein
MHPWQVRESQASWMRLCTALRRGSCATRLTEAVVDQKIERMPVAGNSELALWVLKLLQALYGHGVEVAAVGRVLREHGGPARDEAVDERHPR